MQGEVTDVLYGVLLTRIMHSQGIVEVVKNQDNDFKAKYLREVFKPKVYGRSNLGKMQIPYTELKPWNFA